MHLSGQPCDQLKQAPAASDRPGGPSFDSYNRVANWFFRNYCPHYGMEKIIRQSHTDFWILILSVRPSFMW